MNVSEFMEIKQAESKEYCACLVEKTGDIFAIRDGHLNALVEYYGDPDILVKMPKDVSPMFWLMAKTGVVVVDYENQVHSGELTQEQRKTLIALAEAGRIRVNLYDINGKFQL